ncbi:MAG: HAD family phosphatase [Planctomycetota bacterium]
MSTPPTPPTPPTPQPHHRALIFDCDGTLADSMPVHWVAWNETLKTHGLDHLMPHDRFLAWGGVPARRIFQTLAEEAGRSFTEDELAALAAEKYDNYFKRADTIQPVEPILAIAREHRGKLPMAVATGSTRHGVTRTLTAINATDWWGAIVTADDVTHSKPHPETFLKAAEALGVDPKDCLAYEDADPGITAAQDAGMDVCDVRTVIEPASK